MENEYDLKNEQDPVMLSALEHYVYCPRQCALIHIEQTFDENIYTMRGRAVHENVDVESSRFAGGMKVERALPLWCARLGLVGKADAVEFKGGVPYPVEYKSGKKGRRLPEAIQLCGQALCLEEMLGVAVPNGALYFHGSRERVEVVFTDALKKKVEDAALAVREMLQSGRMPPPVNDARCEECSLNDSCAPGVVANKRAVKRILTELYQIDEAG